MQTKVAFVSMHEVFMKRVPGLTPTKPTDVRLSAAMFELRHSVPGKHRGAVVEAVRAKLKSRKWKDNKAAITMATNLRRFLRGMKETADNDGKTVAERAATKGNGHEHAAAPLA